MEIKTSLFSFLLVTQFIVDTKVPIWVFLAKTGVLKVWVRYMHPKKGTRIPKGWAKKGGVLQGFAKGVVC